MSDGLRDLAVLVDGRLAELYEAEWDLDRQLRLLEGSVRSRSGQRQVRSRSGWVTVWSGSWEQARSWAEADRWGRERLVARERLVGLLELVRAEQAEGDSVWSDFEWTRAFLVLGDDGHVHSSMRCSTCRPSTRFEWLVSLSGASEEDIVAAAGRSACTVCYPSAPVEVLSRDPVFVSRERSARDAAAQARLEARGLREAKRRAAAPTLSGEPLRIPASWWGGGPEVLATERSAVSTWVGIETGYGEPSAAMRESQRLICEALAAKHGVPVDQQWELLLGKAVVKRKRDARG